MYSASSLQMHIANQQILLDKYNFLNWDAISRFISKLLEDA